MKQPIKINEFAPLGTAGTRFDNGGKGSGNFGHAGRPGERGGSASSASVGHISEYIKKAEKSGALPKSKKTNWDAPYEDITKTDQLGTGDYAEAGFFTSGNFTVDSKLTADEAVQSVKDYHILKDMLFEAETIDHLAKDSLGKQIETSLTDLLEKLHTVDAYGSATFETDKVRQAILRRTAADVVDIQTKLRLLDKSAKEMGYGKYVDKAQKLCEDIYGRALHAETREGWNIHETGKPQVAGGDLTTDRVLKDRYDEHKIQEQRREESLAAYAFSR